MVFAAPSAMWLYCTGAVFGGKGRLLTTQKERESEIKQELQQSQKSIKQELGQTRKKTGRDE